MSRENRCLICYTKLSGHDDLLSFHSFPKDKDTKDKWIDFCINFGCLTKNDYVENLKICSTHFSQAAYEETTCTGKKLQLKAGAVPSLPLDDDKFTNSTESTNQTYVETSVKAHQELIIMPPHSGAVPNTKCCVPGCNSIDHNTNFYKFPLRVLLVNMWKSVLQICRSQMVTNFYVCEQHFDQRDFLPETKELRRLAVPSILRNDKRLNLQVVEKNTGQCSCKCTCGNRQDNMRYPNSEALENFPIPTQPRETSGQSTKGDHLPVASPKQYSIDRLSEFEESQVNKENAIVVCEKSARIVITSDNSSLRLKIAHQVRKLLRENTGGNVLTPPDELGICEVDAGPNLEKYVTEGPLYLSDSEETAAIAEETTPKSNFDCTKVYKKISQAPSHPKLHSKISLMKRYKEMTKKFGSKCLYCGYMDADMLYHIRRIHYGMFPEGPISDETIYKELINQMETLEEEEEEFPSHYLNTNYKITCQYCAENFPDVVALIIHVKGVHETTCGPLPLSEDQLKSGMRNCRFCNRILNNLEDYSFHVSRCLFNPASRGYKEPQICEICGQTGTRDQVKAHRLRSHCNDYREKFICEICGRTLSSTTYYKYHLLRHENKRGLRCRVEGCNKLFNTPACLQKHHATHLPPEAWKFACNICGKKFRNKNFLLKHEESHSMAHRHQCMMCGKILKGKAAMQIHVSKFHRSSSWSERRVFRSAAAPRERGMAMGGNRSKGGYIGDRKGAIKQRANKRVSELQGGGLSMAKRSRESKISQEEYWDIDGKQGDRLEDEEEEQLHGKQNIKRSDGSSGNSNEDYFSEEETE